MQRQPEFINRPDASPREQLADKIWNLGQRIIDLETAVKNCERRFGKNYELTKDYRTELKAATTEQERLRKEFNQAR